MATKPGLLVAKGRNYEPYNKVSNQILWMDNNFESKCVGEMFA